MARINTNVASVIAQSTLARNQADLNVRLERLSTGLRINRGADDPAGLIISERIRSDLAGIEQGIKNSDRASSVIATAEASLTEINDLLNSIRALIVESANTGANSAEEREANQLQIDSAIDSITRISNTATFGGLRLLDGTLDYRMSGVDGNAIALAQVRGASLIENAALQVEVDVVASAQRGMLFLSAPSGQILSSMTLEIKGLDGVQQIQFASNTSLDRVVNAINSIQQFTGVQAVLVNSGNLTSGLVFYSTEYGADAFASVRRLNPPATGDSFAGLYKLNDGQSVPSLFNVGTPTFNWAALQASNALVLSNQDFGRDVSALVNGSLANGRGLELTTNTPGLALKLRLAENFATAPGGPASNFQITGGGALFQLGPEVTALQQSNFGIGSVAASRLGASQTDAGIEFLSSLRTGGRNSIAEAVRRNDFKAAQIILQSSIDDITELRGRLGAFERNVLDTNVRSLQSQFENLTASGSRIRDADFAAETSRLTRAQILVQAGTSALQLANTQSQQVLQLLGG